MKRRGEAHGARGSAPIYVLDPGEHPEAILPMLATEGYRGACFRRNAPWSWTTFLENGGPDETVIAIMLRDGEPTYVVVEEAIDRAIAS